MADDLPFSRHGPASPALPVVVAVPHAGRCYPPALLDAARLPRSRLEPLEDRHAERISDRLLEAGATIFVARQARAFIDLNRDPREIDPAMVTPRPQDALATARVRGGLGIVPRRVNGAEIYDAPLPLTDIMARIDAIHAPWHMAIADALAAARSRFGFAILIDCHSMPPLRPHGGGAAIVLGDRSGRSAHPAVIGAARALLAARGVPTACNDPYAGGYTLDLHGRPEAGIHAMQIEFCRTLYLDPTLRTPSDGLARVQSILADIGQALAGSMAPAAP